MRTWYSIQNAAEDTATVTIFDEIGYWGITAADFNREFRAIKASIINLEINSPGGSVFDGIAIYNMLKASGKTINAKVMGVAASIASIILMAADKITMPANTMQMVHSPAGGVFGTADEMRDMADVLDKVKASLIGVYMKRTGKTEEEVTAMLAKDTWMTAAEAKEAGFADEVVDAVEMTAKFDMERIPEAARAAFKAAAKPPVATPAPTSAPVATNSAPIAEQIVAAANAAGFEAHAAAWAVAFTKLEDVTARIGEAREIKALCVAVAKADLADGYIQAGKTLAEARTELTNAMAANDTHVDTTKKVGVDATDKTAEALNSATVYAKRSGAKTDSNSNQPANKAPSAVSTADIWAKRNKQTAGV